MDWLWLDWAAVAALGGLVGASELISRYKDDPVAALKAWSGILYIAINGAASVAALGLIHANGWFGRGPGDLAPPCCGVRRRAQCGSSSILRCASAAWFA